VIVTVPALVQFADPRAPKPGLPVQAIAGIALAVTGVVTVGAGGIVGLIAKSKHDGATGCNDADQCDLAGTLARRDARQFGNVATALVAVGGGVTIAGLATWLASPAPLGVKPAPKHAGVGLALGVSGVLLFGGWP
jgi:hypothetical protein